MSNCHHQTDSSHDKSPAAEKHRFAKAVRTYLTVNLIMFALMIISGGTSGWWKVAVIWGAVLAAKGLWLYGWPKLDPDYDDYDEQERYREQQSYHRRPRRPHWRDKDLV
jgi:hypothetical protein